VKRDPGLPLGSLGLPLVWALSLISGEVPCPSPASTPLRLARGLALPRPRG